MNGIKVNAETDDRSPEQAARAAPVSLPAGSYDSAELDKALSAAAKAKDEDARAAAVDKALADTRAKSTEHAALGVQPDQKLVEVTDERLGITETRRVYDPSTAEEAPAEPAPTTPAPRAAEATKGE